MKIYSIDVYFRMFLASFLLFFVFKETGVATTLMGALLFWFTEATVSVGGRMQSTIDELIQASVLMSRKYEHDLDTMRVIFKSLEDQNKQLAEINDMIRQKQSEETCSQE